VVTSGPISLRCE